MPFSIGNFLLGGLGQAPDPNASKFSDRDYIMQQIQNGLGSYANRQAPQAGRTMVGQVAQGTGSTIDQSRYNDWRNQQMALAQQLGAVASGQQQGAGELAVQRQVQQGLAGQQAMARMARGGGNAGMALRSAAGQSAGIGLSGAGQSQQAALQDQAQARALQAGVLGQGAGQDIGVAQGNAQLQQQMNLANLDAQNQRVFQQAGLDQSTSLANMQARLQTMGMNDEQIRAYMSNLLGMNAAELQARMGQEQAQMGQTGVLGDILSAAGSAAASGAGGAASSGGGAAGAAGAA